MGRNTQAMGKKDLSADRRDAKARVTQQRNALKTQQHWDKLGPKWKDINKKLRRAGLAKAQKAKKREELGSEIADGVKSLGEMIETVTTLVKQESASLPRDIAKNTGMPNAGSICTVMVALGVLIAQYRGKKP